MNKENYFISLLTKKNPIIGDDGALIDDYIYSQDAFFENIHFKRDWLTLTEIAEKSMLVNISDAIAMNAKPLYALLTVAIPKNFNKQNLDELSLGFLNIAKKYNIKIVGGDTISNSKLDISITIISKASKKTIFRKGLKRNHLVAFTGKLGSSLKDLKTLFKGGKISKKSRFIKPILRDDFFYNISKYVSSGIDISDGLSFELERLSKINRCGFKFFYKFQKKIKCSGEEYEMLFTFDKKYKDIINNLAKKHKVKLNIFAKVTKGKYKNICKINNWNIKP